jgi:ABC-type multidrug transport system ATPase subunit
VILGENGAGKSTLLRVMAGLLRPSSGTCEVAGQVGYMAHASMLYDELSGVENLRYFEALYGIEDARRSRELLEMVHLDPELNKPIRDYSQGMRQRLSLARSVVHAPDVLLLDEPFSNVDAASVKHIVDLLAQWRDDGKTIVVVTHQPAVLEHVADEFITMTNGLMTDQRIAREVHA